MSAARERRLSTRRWLASLLVLGLGLAGCSGPAIRLNASRSARVGVYLLDEEGAPARPLVQWEGDAPGDAIVGLPRDLANQRVRLLVTTERGAWIFTIFTDREVPVRVPPSGEKVAGVGGIEAIPLETAAALIEGRARPVRRAEPAHEEAPRAPTPSTPSASLSPD